MDYLPLFFKLSAQACLIVGGGEVAVRKTETLRQAGGNVTVVAPQLAQPLRELHSQGHIVWLEKPFAPSDVDGFKLVVSATSEHSVNVQVFQAAQARNIPVNVVDCPELCSFIFPAIIDRSPIVAAISSGGASPVLAKLLRVKLETLIPPEYAALARLAQRFRQTVKQAIVNADLRRRFWQDTLQGEVAELALAGREDEAAHRLVQSLQEIDAKKTGMVFLVGAGPGDPDLLTLRALRLMQEADVVVYDRLVSPDIMRLVRKDAEKIYVGKQNSHHTLPQSQINRLLADIAHAGRRVVRLKGGDPFIFGRGGEEIETLMAEGIHFQVVPGITAASGCAAYAGIPLTHRDYAQSCAFVTGHLKDGTIDLEWERLAVPKQTLVIYMGLQGLGQICAGLIRHGCPASLPAALIQQGTTRHQRVLTGTLADLPDKVAQADSKAPSLVIVGEVVKLHEKLAWFGQRQNA